MSQTKSIIRRIPAWTPVLLLGASLKLVPTAAGVTADFDLKHPGQAAGANVAQHCGQPDQTGAMRPEKELQNSKNVFLKPDETQTVLFPPAKNAFAGCRPEQKPCVEEHVAFKIPVGGSARDARLAGEFPLRETRLVK